MVQDPTGWTGNQEALVWEVWNMKQEGLFISQHTYRESNLPTLQQTRRSLSTSLMV